jgi:hypothetical protein
MPSWSPSHDLSDLAEGRVSRGWGDVGMPGARVVMWSGLDIKTRVRIGRNVDALHIHNDCGVDFAEIADAIEAQL